MDFLEDARRLLRSTLSSTQKEETIQTMMGTLSTFLHKHLEEDGMHDLKLYSSSWAICSRFAFLFSSSRISNPPLTIHSTILLLHDSSRSYADLESLFGEIVALARPFVNGDTAIGLEILPPFITHLFYKAASIMTERIRVGDDSRDSLERLKLLRSMLKLIGMRWMGARESITYWESRSLTLKIGRPLLEVIGRGYDPEDGQGDGVKCDASPLLSKSEELRFALFRL